MPELQNLRQELPGVTSSVSSGIPQSIAAVIQPQRRLDNARQLLSIVGAGAGLLQQDIAQKSQEKAFEQGREAMQKQIGELAVKTDEQLAQWATKVKSGEMPLGANPYVAKLGTDYAYRKLAQSASRHLSAWYAQSPYKGAEPDIVADKARKELYAWAQQNDVDVTDPRYIATFNPEIERYFSNDLMRQASNLYVSVNQARLMDDTRDLSNDAAATAINNLIADTGIEDRDSLIAQQAGRIQERIDAVLRSGASPAEANEQAWRGVEASIRNNMTALLTIEDAPQQDGTTPDELIKATYAANLELINKLPEMITTTQRADGTMNTWASSTKVQEQKAQLINYLDNVYDESRRQLANRREKKDQTVIENATMDFFKAYQTGGEPALTAAFYQMVQNNPDVKPEDLNRLRNIVAGDADEIKKNLGQGIPDADFPILLAGMDDLKPSEYIEQVDQLLTGKQREQALARFSKRSDYVANLGMSTMKDIYSLYDVSLNPTDAISAAFSTYTPEQRLRVKRILHTATAPLRRIATMGSDIYAAAEGMNKPISEIEKEINGLQGTIIKVIDEQLASIGAIEQADPAKGEVSIEATGIQAGVKVDARLKAAQDKLQRAREAAAKQATQE